MDTNLLDWLQKHPQCEVSYSAWDEDPCWQVHVVSGGRNDREWTLIGHGETVREAIAVAKERMKRRAH